MTIRSFNLARAAAVFYATVAVMTFGHSAANNHPRILYEQMVCDEARAAGMKRLPDRCNYENSPKVRAAAQAAFAGLGWPLYWAWEAFE